MGALIVWVAATGCEGSAGKASSGSCATAAREFCEASFRCAPDFAVSAFGNETACLAWDEAGCGKAGADIDDPVWRRKAQDQWLACSRGYAKVTCDVILAGEPIPGCEPLQPPPGPKPDGASCTWAGDCRSGLCELDLTAEDFNCFKCTTPPQNGEPCVFTCADGLLCLEGTCGRAPLRGEPCTDRCAYSLVCQDERCATPASAPREPIPVGAACNPDQPECGFVTQFCDPATRTCQPRKPNGATCVDPLECEGGACESGTCRTRVPMCGQ